MIEIRNLQKTDQGKIILEVEDLVITSGEIVAVVGMPGSGIETLADLVLGKFPPSAGEVRLAELNPASSKQSLSEHIGVLFKEDSLYKDRTVEGNLKFFNRLYGLPGIRVLEVLQQIGLADLADASFKQLSPGLIRRLAFGRAILNNPEILILEEPFSNCDADSITWMLRLIRMQAEQGTTVLILTETSAHLDELCNRILTLNNGRVDSIREGGETQTGALPFKIPVKLEGRVALLNPSEILYAEASKGRTTLKTRDSLLPSQFTLNELEERLKRSGFFRAHRSFLVNLQYVREVIPYSRNSYSLGLDVPEQTEIPLSKGAAAELRELLNY
jgi:ABC-2 type transport system ATP-binding protein